MSIALDNSELVLPKGEVEWPETMEPGIYFGLPEDDYHADPSFSYSGIKRMRVHPLEYWAHSHMNALRPEDEDTKATLMGRAYDRRVVEGKAAFLANYAPRLEPGDYPDALRTVDDLKARLKDLGQKIGGNKDDLIERLLEADPEARIWSEIESDYGRKHAGKTLLPPSLMNEIEYRAAMIERHHELSKAFTGGYPQVSVFWRDAQTGVPMKARFDYLKQRAIVDLKTFSNPLGKPIERAIAGAVASGKYHLQAQLYLTAAEMAAHLVRRGRVYGEVDPAWLSRFAANERRSFFWVFQHTGPAPIARGKEFPAAGDVAESAESEIRAAILDYSAHWQKFGELPWVDDAPITAFSNEDFPLWIYE